MLRNSDKILQINQTGHSPAI